MSRRTRYAPRYNPRPRAKGDLIHAVAVENAMKDINGGAPRCGGKLCYESEVRAQATADALNILDLSMRRVYLCPQTGKHQACPMRGTPHWHLTTRRPA